jgi:hypothetical protein
LDADAVALAEFTVTVTVDEAEQPFASVTTRV